MREIIARIVCLVAAGVVLALAFVFAVRHNPRPGAPVTPAAAAAGNIVRPETEAAMRGRAVFERENCATCHLFRGVGNPRYPLEDAARRRSPTELRAWITGDETVAGALSGAVLRRKRRYAELPGEELEALVAFLSEPRGEK